MVPSDNDKSVFLKSATQRNTYFRTIDRTQDKSA